jgi:acyl carrier protein
MKTENEFLEILKDDVFNECEDIILFDTNFKELECWDSITALTLIALFDSEFDYKLTGDLIKNCNLISDLYQLVN